MKLSPLLLTLAFPALSLANGVLRNGVGGRATGLAGSVVAMPLDPLATMSANPAGLAAFRESTFQLGAFAIYADAEFSGGADGTVSLAEPFGIAPEIAFATPLGKDFTLGISSIPEVTRLSEWQYTDALGGLDGGTSYGKRLHRAEIISIRTALGLGMKVNEVLSIGGSLGLAYQDISLHAPFIFQNFLPLRGIKTPLALETTDPDAWNGDLGFVYKANDALSIGFNFRSKTEITSEGTAKGNADRQLANLGLGAARSDFAYDATVETALPAVLSAGANWTAHPRLRFSGQVEWVNWADSFDTLVVKLSRGNNADLNGLAGGDSLTDRIPLDWKNTLVYRAGVEYSPADRWWLRGGYAYGENPIPNRNLTPLNAAISEHTLSAGLGYVGDSFRVDFGYQIDLPHRENTGDSNILDQEYSNTSTKLTAHWFSLSVTTTF